MVLGIDSPSLSIFTGGMDTIQISYVLYTKREDLHYHLKFPVTKINHAIPFLLMVILQALSHQDFTAKSIHSKGIGIISGFEVKPQYVQFNFGEL